MTDDELPAMAGSDDEDELRYDDDDDSHHSPQPESADAAPPTPAGAAPAAEPSDAGRMGADTGAGEGPCRRGMQPARSPARAPPDRAGAAERTSASEVAAAALGRETDSRARRAESPPIWLKARDAWRSRSSPPRSPLKGRRVDREKVDTSCIHLEGVFKENQEQIERELVHLLKTYTRLPRAAVDDQPLHGWLGSAQRVKVFYGKAYTYKNGPVHGVRTAGEEELVIEVPEIPEWIKELVLTPLQKAGAIRAVEAVDMVTINFYSPGSFIVGHRDPLETFEPSAPIVTTTFLSPGGLEIGGRWDRYGRKGVPEDSARTVLMLPGDALVIFGYTAHDTIHSVPAPLTCDGIRAAIIPRVSNAEARRVEGEELKARLKAEPPRPWLHGSPKRRTREEWVERRRRNLLWREHFKDQKVQEEKARRRREEEARRRSAGGTPREGQAPQRRREEEARQSGGDEAVTATPRRARQQAAPAAERRAEVEITHRTQHFAATASFGRPLARTAVDPRRDAPPSSGWERRDAHGSRRYDERPPDRQRPPWEMRAPLGGDWGKLPPPPPVLIEYRQRARRPSPPTSRRGPLPRRDDSPRRRRDSPRRRRDSPRRRDRDAGERDDGAPRERRAGQQPVRAPQTAPRRISPRQRRRCDSPEGEGAEPGRHRRREDPPPSQQRRQRKRSPSGERRRPQPELCMRSAAEEGRRVTVAPPPLMEATVAVPPEALLESGGLRTVCRADGGPGVVLGKCARGSAAENAGLGAYEGWLCHSLDGMSAPPGQTFDDEWLQKKRRRTGSPVAVTVAAPAAPWPPAESHARHAGGDAEGMSGEDEDAEVEALPDSGFEEDPEESAEGFEEGDEPSDDAGAPLAAAGARKPTPAEVDVERALRQRLTAAQAAQPAAADVRRVAPPKLDFAARAGGGGASSGAARPPPPPSTQAKTPPPPQQQPAGPKTRNQRRRAKEKQRKAAARTAATAAT
eukprot:gene7490-6403_t